jgi:hypothetical protein
MGRRERSEEADEGRSPDLLYDALGDDGLMVVGNCRL